MITYLLIQPQENSERMSHHKRHNKAKNQQYHAKMRMLEHYGIAMSYADLEKMAELYRHDLNTVILLRRSLRITKAIVAYKGKCYPVIYDSTRHQIVTILKAEYLSASQQDILNNCQLQQTTKE